MFLTTLVLAATVAAAELPAGKIIPDVKCDLDASQSYALYLPSSYTPDRTWPVIFAFDPGGRGINGPDRYQAAAEQYGFIVAGSNNARNGQSSHDAVIAMTGDVIKRFHVDLTRMYVAGMSGGARVALGVALASSTRVAGVMASSAGYPDGQPRKTLPFPLFETAGTEDFNHLEMRKIDRELTSPHHLAIFEGGHLWLSSAMAVEAVEWMEIQAIKTGLKPRDEKELDQIFAKRTKAIGAGNDKDAFLALQSVVADFTGLRDVSAFAARSSELGRSKAVTDALKKDREEDDREGRMLEDVWAAEDRLMLPQERAGALNELRQRWRQLSEQAKKTDDSVERRLARRVLSGLSAGGTNSKDEEYLKIVREFRTGRGGRGN